MPEVQALELYEDQAHRTVVGGAFFTLVCLGFLMVSRLHMRREEYTDHPMAFYARLGIFLPPLMVAAFASLIRPYPDKHHNFERTGKDFSNPTYITAATHCAVPSLAGQPVSEYLCVFCLLLCMGVRYHFFLAQAL